MAKFIFDKLPNNLSDLQSLPEANIDTPFKTAALTMVALCQYEKNEQATIEMLNFLKGDDNWATMFVKSAGADSPRQIKLRKKPSTGQWFLNEIQCLSDIRIPVSADPWA